VVIDDELSQARESLRYWEQREGTLPRHARRKRREAREHVIRWRERVAAAERETYGRGIAGALIQIATEGRLPEPIRHLGRRTTSHCHRVVLVAAGVTALGLLVMLVGAVGVLLMMLGVV
jgi:hypothetical protein